MEIKNQLRIVVDFLIEKLQKGKTFISTFLFPQKKPGGKKTRTG